MSQMGDAWMDQWPELVDYWVSKVRSASQNTPYTFMGKGPRWTVVVSSNDINGAAASCTLVPLLGLTRAALLGDLTSLEDRFVLFVGLERGQAPAGAAVFYGVDDDGQLRVDEVGTGEGEIVEGSFSQLLAHAMSLRVTENYLDQLVQAGIAARALQGLGCQVDLLPLP